MALWSKKKGAKKDAKNDGENDSKNEGGKDPTSDAKQLERTRQLIHDRVREYRRQQVNLEIDLENRHDDVKDAVEILFHKIFSLFKECGTLRGQRNELGGINQDLRSRNQGLEIKLKDIQTERDRQVEQYNTAIRELKDQHNGEIEWQVREVERRCREDRSKDEARHREDRSRWKDLQFQYESEMADTKRNFEYQVDDRERVHAAKLVSMKTDFGAKVAEQERRHVAKQANTEKNFKEELAGWKNECQKLEDTMLLKQTEFGAEKKMMESNFNAEMNSLKRDFNDRLVLLKKKHVEQQLVLKKDVEYLNGELLARDTWTPLTDNELKSPFQALEIDIDALSRLKWNSNQKEWPNDLLDRLSENQRKLKKQLVQDTVWTILFEKIFCSPFRAFGEEGQSLEFEWNKAYGKGSQGEMEFYDWPTPNLESERWRYRSMTRLQEAVNQPASKWDPNSELKLEYNKSLDSIAKELSETLKKVSYLDQPTQRALDEIPRKAAKIWLEMMTQRCRIVVILPGLSLKSSSNRVEQAREGVVELVDKPELRRLGNSTGQDLDQVAIISMASVIKFSSK